MIKYATPVRLNTPQHCLYTFKDQADNVIDLTTYVSVFLEVKRQSGVSSTTPAEFNGPKTGGQVQLPTFTFTQDGTWYLQFYCIDSSENKLFGEPLQVTVVDNLEDLVANQPVTDGK